MKNIYLSAKGFGKVRCFVGGHDFTRITREDIELVRFKVASLVFMPAHYVYIVGIEPGQRVVITLMLLDRYVQELSEMAREGLAELSLVKVDAVQIYGKTYSTTGKQPFSMSRLGFEPKDSFKLNIDVHRNKHRNGVREDCHTQASSCQTQRLDGLVKR